MVDIILILGFFFLLALGLLGLVFAIPKFVILSTESENDPDHIYTIFMQESGYRGHKVISAAGCLFPFITFSRPNFEIENLIYTGMAAAACAFYHSSVYRGYPVLTRAMSIGMAALFVFCTCITALAKLGHIPVGYFIFLLVSSGSAWGAYAVYRRSELIRITRRSSKDAQCAPLS
ncbi:hypothetical protein [Neptuniibacter sp. QD37_11]|uniref:hypothetical protein n=1 Tax=Neptuniibacter sp. QD37_11 TaxID=3398209 RepID=UPI0039F597EF